MSDDTGNVVTITRGKIVASPEFAEIFGVTRTSITNWTGEGMPVFERGVAPAPNKFNTADCYQWLIAKARQERRGPKPTVVPEGTGKETPKDRLATVDFERKTLELARLKGEMIGTEELAHIAEDFYVNFRLALLDFVRDELGTQSIGPVERFLDSYSKQLTEGLVEEVSQGGPENDGA